MLCSFIPRTLVHGMWLLLLALRDGFYFSDFFPSCTRQTPLPSTGLQTPWALLAGPAAPEGRQPVSLRLHVFQLNSDDIKG